MREFFVSVPDEKWTKEVEMLFKRAKYGNGKKARAARLRLKAMGYTQSEEPPT